MAKILENCKYVVLIAVVALMLAAIATFGWVAVKTMGFIVALFTGGNNTLAIVSLLDMMDTFLIGTVLFIFSVGLYELFIGKQSKAVQTGDEICVIVEPCRKLCFDLFRCENGVPATSFDSLNERKCFFLHNMIQFLPTLPQFKKRGENHQECNGHGDCDNVARLDVGKKCHQKNTLIHNSTFCRNALLPYSVFPPPVTSVGQIMNSMFVTGL